MLTIPPEIKTISNLETKISKVVKNIGSVGKCRGNL